MTTVVVVDTETTGLGERHPDGPRPDAVVQVGIAWRSTGGAVKIWERTCNPGAEFLRDGRADVALGVNGLTTSQILTAPSAASIAKELRVELVRIRQAGGRVDLRAFNCEFDRAFLSRKPWSLRTGWGPCLMIEAAKTFGYESGRVKLGRAAEILGVDVRGRAHSAGTDAATALRVHETILERSSNSRTSQTPLERPTVRRLVPKSGYREGCELCENTGPHEGAHGFFQEGDFYPFDD
jgi:DNA polymerase III epsilon subunit-like protein